MQSYTVRDLADRVSGRVEGDADRTITGVAPVRTAGREDLTFVVDERYGRALEDRRPGAVVVGPEFGAPVDGTAVIRVDEPRLAFGRLVRVFHPEPEQPEGIDPTALVGRGAHVGEGVSVGPYAVVESNAEIGARTRVGPHVYVQSGAVVGEDCVVGPGASILSPVRMGDRVEVHAGARIGTEGYGYAQEGRGSVKIPQVGACIIGDDVEIGANVTIDRGALDDTSVGARTKIDNLVHVAHNARIGEDCMIVAQVGIAGSVEVGDRVQLGGQSGVAGHLSIGDDARIAGRAGVIGDVPEGATYSGYPARPHGRAMRASAALYRMPDVVRRVQALEEQLGMRGEE